MPRWMWSLIALIAVLALYKRVLVLLILARLRLHPESYRYPAEVEAWERDLLQGAAGILSAQGFRFAGYARLGESGSGRPRGRAMAFFEHATEPAWASVMPSEAPIPQCPFQINYVTCFTNGRLLHTTVMREQVFPGDVDYAVRQQVPASDFDSIYAAHAATAAEMGRSAPPERIGLAALLFLGDKLIADQMEASRARGRLVPASDGGLRLSLRGLWTASRLYSATAPAAAKLQQAWAARDQTFPVPPEAEAESFQRMDAMGPRLGNYGKGFLILASLAAFSMLSGGGFSWYTGAMLLAIVFIHEMGHALAMRWVGYRDVNVFFIPFFGAVAIGRDERHPEAWKEAFILLAGPVPGLAAGLAAIWAGGSALPPWAYSMALTSILVNGFNLLPIAPLDGGQLMQLILFRRFPRLNQAFLVLSAFAVAAVAWWAESPLLGFFALVLLWGIYQSGRVGQADPGEAALAGIRARYGEGRDENGRWHPGMIAEFFASLRQGQPAHFMENMARIKAFLAGPADGRPAPPAGVPTALGVFVLYACFLAAPLAWYAFPMLGLFGRGSKLVTAADLEPAQARVYDRLCADSAVYQIGLYSARDSLYLHASVIAPADTARVAALANGLVGGEALRVVVRAPIWGLGGLDSTLLSALRGSGESEDVDGYGYDSADWAAYQKLDSAGQAAWQDSLENVQAVVRRRLDSLRKVEAGIWESWPAERRKEWLAQWKRKRLQYGSEPLPCFKG